MTQYTQVRDRGQRNWWQRNWKWVVPVGGVAVLALFVGAIFALLSLVSGMMRSSEPYRHALTAARASPEVVAALGEPIEPGFMPSGNINVSHDEGNADLSIDVKGPNGEATVYVEATRKRRRWTYRTLVVALDDREIDLLADGSSGPTDAGADIGPHDTGPDDAGPASPPTHDGTRKSGAGKPLDGD